MKSKPHRKPPERVEVLERPQAQVEKFVLEQTAWLAQVQLPRDEPRKSAGRRGRKVAA
jgi:hypothetical protein